MRIFLGRKPLETYRGLLIKADLGLHEQIATRVLEEVPRGGRILDLGAGEGALSARLHDLGYEIIAVDKDAENFRCEEVEFVKVDFDSAEEIADFVDARQGTFDGVLGIEVIEHVQDQWRYARQLIHLAKPGGLVLITTPNITSWMSRLRFFFRGRFHQFGDADLEYGHISPITPWELQLILDSSGMTNVEIRSAGTLPPVYLTGLNQMSILSLLVLPLRPLMRGLIDGWCVMATGRRR